MIVIDENEAVIKERTKTKQHQQQRQVKKKVMGVIVMKERPQYETEEDKK